MTASTSGLFLAAREGQVNVLHATAAISVGSRPSAADPWRAVPVVLAAGAVAARSRDNL